MADRRDGRRFRIPPSRRLSWDLLHFNRHVPLCAHDRLTDLSAIASARQNCPIRISWPSLFLKAYATLSAQVPELRQIWYSLPWAHLYQHPVSVGVVTVHREIHGVPWLFWGNVGCPETQRLEQLQACLDRFRTAPVKKVFRRQLQLAGLPTPLRRLIWRWNLYVETAARARRMGTFFLSTLASRGAEIQLPPSIHTGCLTYGPLDSERRCRVTLAYDHRVLDGALAAEALRSLEHILNFQLTAELNDLNSRENTVSIKVA